MMNYMEWCNQQERCYDRMPMWFWRENERRQHYENYKHFIRQQNREVS